MVLSGDFYLKFLTLLVLRDLFGQYLTIFIQIEYLLHWRRFLGKNEFHMRHCLIERFLIVEASSMRDLRIRRFLFLLSC